MGMVLLDSGPVQSWLDQHHAGDKLIAFTRVVSPSIPDMELANVTIHGSKLTDVATTTTLLGLDPAATTQLLRGKAGLLALTSSRFYVFRLGGLWEKVKATVLDAAVGEVTFTVRDFDDKKLSWRHWVVGLPDGKHFAEPQAMSMAGKPTKIAPGSHHFLESLGDRARRVIGEVG